MGCNRYAGRPYPVLFAQPGCEGDSFEVTQPGAQVFDLPRAMTVRSVYLPAGWKCPQLEPLIREGALPLRDVPYLRFERVAARESARNDGAIVAAAVGAAALAVVVVVAVFAARKKRVGAQPR